MAFFQINLARGYSVPLRRRLLWNWILVAYLGVCGVLLAALVNVTTRDLLAQHRRQRELVERETRVLRACGAEGERDVVVYARSLSREMALAADRLEGLGRALSRRPPLAAVLLGLATALPEGTCLGSFELHAETRQVTFEVYVMPEREEEGLTPPQLVALWNLDTNLMSHVREIKSVQTQQGKLGGMIFGNWKFTGVLAATGQ